MFKINNWKEQLYKDDVINVVLNGILTALLVGVLAGVVDFLFQLINFPLSFGLIIITYLLGTRMRKGYYSYHILYPTLSILFMLVSLFVADLAQICLIFGDITVLPSVLSNPNFYLDFLLGPIYYIISTIKSFNILYLLVGIIDIAIYIWAFMYCFKLVKGRN